MQCLINKYTQINVEFSPNVRECFCHLVGFEWFEFVWRFEGAVLLEELDGTCPQLNSLKPQSWNSVKFPCEVRVELPIELTVTMVQRAARAEWDSPGVVWGRRFEGTCWNWHILGTIDPQLNSRKHNPGVNRRRQVPARIGGSVANCDDYNQDLGQVENPQNVEGWNLYKVEE